MASSSLLFSSLQFQFNPPKRSSSKLTTRQFVIPPIFASVSQTPSEPPTKLPIREIPGNYGLPFFGPLKDQQDFYYDLGRNEFFRSKIKKYQSTVFRTNIPPGSLIAPNPKVVCLLDGKSFPILFDVHKVDKRDLFTGTFMPSIEFTGGYRVLSYLDPSECSHGKLKKLMFFLLKTRREKVIPEFSSCFGDLFETLEGELATKGKANFGEANNQASFNFLAKSLFGKNPADSKLGLDAPKLIDKWVLLQLAPFLTLGLPKGLENLLMHTFPLPPCLVKKDYQRLYDFFYESSWFMFDEAHRLGISKDEACHNLLFATCFNSFGGMKIFFPNMLKWIGQTGVKVHTQLAEEIRSVIRSNDGKITMAAMEKMSLMKSVVYECLRVEPPVPLQYGKAKYDLIVSSHDASFEVKEGEMMVGYQPFATKDPKLFQRAEEFVADRFVGEGEEMLKHVLWSNGPETENPNVGNKQCAGKDFVVLVSRLFVIELFLRYDSFDIEVGRSPFGASVTLTSLKRMSL